MTQVTMIFGEIGAGKTTYARELEANGSIRLSLDEWTIAATGDRVHVDKDLVDRMIDQLMQLWPGIVARDVDVVLDLGFWDRGRRDEVRTVAASLGADVRLVHVRCAVDERRRRCTSRPSRPGTYEVDNATFDWITQNRMIDPLGADEPHSVVDTTPDHLSLP